MSKMSDQLKSKVKNEAGKDDEFDQYVLKAESEQAQNTPRSPDWMLNLVSNDSKTTTVNLGFLFNILHNTFGDYRASSMDSSKISSFYEWREKFRPYYKRFSDSMQVCASYAADKQKLIATLEGGLAKLEKYKDNIAVGSNGLFDDFGSAILKPIEAEARALLEKHVQKQLTALGDDLKKCHNDVSKLNARVVDGGFLKFVFGDPVFRIVDRFIDIFRACINMFRRTPQLAEQNDKKIEQLEKICAAFQAFKDILVSQQSVSADNVQADASGVKGPDTLDIQKALKKLQDELGKATEKNPSVLGSIVGAAYGTITLLFNTCANAMHYARSGKPISGDAASKFTDELHKIVAQVDKMTHDYAKGKDYNESELKLTGIKGELSHVRNFMSNAKGGGTGRG